jgi:hypothetical protein
MKKILIYHLWKYLLVLGGMLFVINVFRYINNPSIKTLIGMSGFLLIFISLRKIKSQQNEKI